MLRIYPVILDWLDVLDPVVRSVAARDPHLGDQLRRSSNAVALNVAEGMVTTGKAKTNAYRIACREMRESLTALEIAVRRDYVVAFRSQDEDRQQRIIATLIRLSAPKVS